MRIYEQKDNPKLVSLTNLWKVEQALVEHKPKPKQDIIEEEKEDDHQKLSTKVESFLGLSVEQIYEKLCKVLQSI